MIGSFILIIRSAAACSFNTKMVHVLVNLWVTVPNHQLFGCRQSILILQMRTVLMNILAMQCTYQHINMRVIIIIIHS